LTIPLPGPEVSREELQRRFERAYWERFGVELREIRAVLVNLHTAVIGLRRRFDLAALPARGALSAPGDAARAERPVWFDGGWRTTPVLRREALAPGMPLEGPAIIEQLDCTILLEPGNAAVVDRIGNLVVSTMART
jgi:N-methylhydantoinase A